MSTNKDEAYARMMMAIHCDALHKMLDGAEVVIDGRAVAAVYLARLGRIMSTLRVRGLTNQTEIEALAEHFTLAALDDASAGTAKDPEGREILASGDKAKLH